LADQLGAIVEVFHVALAGRPDHELWAQLHAGLRPEDEVQVRSNVADPASAILQVAREPTVQAVVLTTHGRSIEPGRSLGRVAQDVIASTRQPVLLVRPEAGTGTEVAHLHRLLLPVDGAAVTAASLGPAIELARRIEADLDLLLVVSPDESMARGPGAIGAPRYVDQPHHEWAAWRGQMINHLAAGVGEQPSDLRIQAFLAVGDVAAEITRFAAERCSDALVLVRHSHLEDGRARVLRTVLECLPCPALLLAARQVRSCRTG
jgi:nucleotide-binding universal stress UspA family protein